MSNLLHPRPWILAACALAAALVPGGCPSDDPGQGGPVTAKIAVSAPAGPAPLRVSFSAAESSSTAGEIVGYRWDFGGLGTSTASQVQFSFENPGRYTVSLEVTDAAGNTGLTTVAIQSQGGTATAVLEADILSGPAPLSVLFDGSGSTAAGTDRIVEYYWSFGDGGTSRSVDPVHTYTAAGVYTATLRVIAGGGAESTATATITVGEGGGSLQFAPGQFATLRLDSPPAELDEFTLETWVRAEPAGGGVLTFGSPQIAVAVVPDDGEVTVRAGGEDFAASAAGLADAWRHVAVTAAAGELTVYLDGEELTSGPFSGSVTPTALTLGGTFRGRIAATRVWSVARSASDIAANYNRQITSPEDGLISSFPIDERSGQSLADSLGGPGGTLGASTATEDADPAWSSDSP